MLAHMFTRNFTSFTKKMADIIDTTRAQRVQTNTLNEIYSAQNEAKLRQKVTIETTVDNLQK